MMVRCSWQLPGCEGLIEVAEPGADGLRSHGCCASCAAVMNAELVKEMEQMARDAEQADIDERQWAEQVLITAPRCVVEDLAAGVTLDVAAEVARELLSAESTPPVSHQ